MILSLPDLPTPLQFDELFGRPGPVEVEIGLGKGRFLRERATAFPKTNFLGIEKARKWLLYAEKRLKKAELENVRLAITFAEGFMERYIPDQSISIYHVLFPDPWPKRRHNKRRIFNPQFMNEIVRTLTPTGELHVATDYADYFTVIMEELTAVKELKTEPAEPGPFLSNFQVKYVAEGRPLYFAVATRR